MQRFKDQVAIIAGGARGIGRGVGQRLLQEGAKVFLFDVLEEELKAAKQALSKISPSVHIQVVDITQEKDVQQAIQQVIDQYGRLDILINCAGIIGYTSVKIADFDSAVFDQVLNVNLKGAFLLTKHAIPPMLQRNYGRILHITSIGGKDGNPGMVGYAASKSGLIGLIKGVGKEYAENGITVNGIAPAVIATPMNADTDPAMLQYMTDKIPMKRLGTVEEAAALACWIVSPEASFNTGFVFDLSGGRATY
jgi:3-oxoacyl-[acyl-carrier protein] reductase